MPTVATFAEWREAARGYLAAEFEPGAVRFRDARSARELFGDDESSANVASSKPPPHVPKSFIPLAEKVSFHRDEERWNVLYRVLWRLTHGEPRLLEVTTDADVYRLVVMEKAVRRDAHKMKAFVRFRRVETEAGEHFIAWHRPDFPIVRLTAPFFARRFSKMDWSILTPEESVSWDKSSLTYGPGVPASEAPRGDALEELWKDYYRSIFNPARINLKTMKREMPVRHWRTLPETAIIDEMLAEAPARIEMMMARQEGFRESAADFIPANATWDELKRAAAGCRGCDLCRYATQTVFGEGPTDAKIVLVGEQPGDQEDRVGRPFVGPAGAVLDAACAEAGVDRGAVYVTNAVKHFKFEERGSARLHKRPGVRETVACRPWLVAELAIVQPQVLVCLGATAAQSVIGRDFRIHERRGEVVATELCERTMATYHPASILRVSDAGMKERMRGALVADLRTAWGLVG